MMMISEGEHKTAHYAICTGFMALGMMIPGMFSGVLQESIGYYNFFIWVIVATIPGLILIKFLPIHSNFGKRNKILWLKSKIDLFPSMHSVVPPLHSWSWWTPPAHGPTYMPPSDMLNGMDVHLPISFFHFVKDYFFNALDTVFSHSLKISKMPVISDLYSEVFHC